MAVQSDRRLQIFITKAYIRAGARIHSQKNPMNK